MYTIKLNLYYTVIKLILQKNHTFEKLQTRIPPKLHMVELLEAKNRYSDLPNIHAANLIIFLEKKTPTQPY